MNREAHHRFTVLAVLAAVIPVVACGGTTAAGGQSDAASVDAAGPGVDVGDADRAGNGGDAGPPTGTAACTIAASNYDQSCTADSDCVTSAGSYFVAFGDYCQARCPCGGGSINKSSAARFAADVAKTPVGSGAVPPLFCGCPLIPGAGCCQNGACQEFCTAATACTPESPCMAGSNGCPSSGLPMPALGDACSPRGINCYGYGSFSCPVTLTCSSSGQWNFRCAEHPFGTDSGTCACQ